MESEHLNSAADDSLDRLLREPCSAPIADDGFSTRVLAALPPRTLARAPARWTRPAAISLGGLAGAALLWMHRAPGFGFDDAALQGLEQLFQPQVGWALLAVGLTLLAAYLPQVRQKFSL